MRRRDERSGSFSTSVTAGCAGSSERDPNAGSRAIYIECNKETLQAGTGGQIEKEVNRCKSR